MKAYPRWVDRLATEPHDRDLSEQVRKRTIRALYGVAMLAGAPYERSWRKYRDNLLLFAPRLVGAYDHLLAGPDSDQSLVALAQPILDELRAAHVVGMS